MSEEDGMETGTLRRKIMITVLGMLQDSDPDVRTVAVKAATKLYSMSNKQAFSSPIHVLLLPEWILERTFPLTFAANTSGKCEIEQVASTMASLQAIILDNC